MDAFDVIRRDPRVDELARRLGDQGGVVTAAGLWGSCAPILAAIASQKTERPLLLVTAHSDEADDFRDDIETATGIAPALFPALESLPGEDGADDELAAERLRLCMALSEGTAATIPRVIVAPIQALMQTVPTRAAIAASSRLIARGMTVAVDEFAAWLEATGFSRCEQVETPGDFAIRGGIIDVYSHAHGNPVRIELFGEEVESIRLFDAGTQRSATTLESVRIPAIRVSSNDSRLTSEKDATTGFLAYLPVDAIVAFNEPIEIQEIGRSYWQRLGEPAGMIPSEAIFRRAADFARLDLQRFVGGAESDPRHIAFDVGSLPQFEARTEDSLRPLLELAGECEVRVLCDNEPEWQRFVEMLAQATEGERADARNQKEASPDQGSRRSRDRRIGRSKEKVPNEPRAEGDQGGSPKGTAGSSDRVNLAGNADPDATKSSPDIEPYRLSSAADATACGGDKSGRDLHSKTPNPKSKITPIVGVIHRGFRWGLIAFLPHHELFGRYRQRRTLRKIQPARPIDSFFDLNPGDHVVHVMHGIGKFVGLTSLDKGDRREEYLAIQFAGEATVHVPISQIDLVQKYVGAFRGRPKLSKLGGTGWKKTKERVTEAVDELAADLLAVQARRAVESGVAYPRDTTWQGEFEGSFLYEETPDQLRAIGEIKGDMTRPRPMDRLLCGDVGFGKTELAMRAAFKVVEYGKQVAVLVPTTVLAEQHYMTFRERMADYPFKVEVISRFRTGGEQKKIVEAARKGQVDVLIGTHRLLSADVRFADLGLVVIDEEQRFGVEAKERLKHMRATVDVLTMTATPIPRTLHMAMLGVKDISSLATPPLDRRAIVTQVRTWDERLVREAIIRELNRDGQVYFVHNFVRDIQAVANQIRALAPEARVVVGHGQMNEHELEDVMYRFMRREADVLVSTSIIESGLDIPAANTIFIHRPERFGLADLHQLRGRVGRSKHRAYAYLLLSAKHPVLPNAAKRLKAIEHYSHVGAGFQIAMRDLEIRGAGNILGPEQSGHIEAVGYEMYCQLLDNAVRRMKKEPTVEFKRVNLDLGISANVPKAYIRGERQRLEVYKRLTSCRAPAEIDALAQDLRDAFGPPPDAVKTLLELAEIRVLAGQWGIRSAVLAPPDVVFTVDDMSRVQPLFATGPGSPRVPDPRTIHWRLPERYLEKPTLLAVLRKQLAGKVEPPANASMSRGKPTPAARPAGRTR